jgi:hypothetical protein
MLNNRTSRASMINFVVTFAHNIVNFGNSVDIALPKPIRDGIKLEAGDNVCIERSKK